MSNDKLSRFKESMLSNEIPLWRKKGMLGLQLILSMVAPFTLLYLALESKESMFAIFYELRAFLVLIFLNVLVQITVSFYVFKVAVPIYFWNAITYLYFLCALWSTYTFAFLIPTQ